MENRKRKKICFICSSGGHFTELYNLKPIADKHDSFLVTEKTDNFATDFCKDIYFIKEINRREKFFVFKFIKTFFTELKIFLKTKPDYVISTGALCSYPMLRIAKLFKKKIIYIESYARVNDLSTTGKKVYPIADLFFVQWPNIIEKYPKAQYRGDFFINKQI